MTIWELLKNGAFNEACIKADEDFKENQNVLSLRNKVYALFLLKKYKEATQLIEGIIKNTKGESDSDYIFLGIAYWALNEKVEALNAWKAGKRSKYSDAAGGVELQIILFFAALKFKDNQLKSSSIKGLDKLLNSKNAINWPSPLGAFILGNITEDELLSKISNNSILRERNLCQVYFVLALKE